MIVDCVTYNGEKDLWDIHYNVLKDHVDEFIVVEFTETFSGKPKKLSFPMASYPEVKYVYIPRREYEKYRKLAKSSPNTKGAEHWKREFMQKESIKDALTHLKDDDLVFVGDCDEIVRPESIEAWKGFTGSPFKIRLDVYAYYLNNRSSEEFYGTLVSKYWHIRTDCLNHLRSNSWKTQLGGGWHFTSMGGFQNVKQKLTDSYTQESYATPEVLNNLEYNIENKRDFLGRDFSYTKDESEWPSYLKEHKQKYVHLCMD